MAHHLRYHGLAVAAGMALVALGITARPASAAGFQINESSASGLGNAYAGGAALAEDASTLWTNPAGLLRLPSRQGVAALHLITPSIKFRDRTSTAASQQPLGDNGGDAGGLNVVPNAYFAWPLDRSLAVGVGLGAPWGLVTEYDDSFIGRFQATKSSIRTVNLNPAVAWKPAPALSLGLGLNVQRIDAEFNNLVNYSAALLSAAAGAGIAPGSATFNAIAQATPGLVSRARVKGSDTAAGWNAGLLWELDKDTRLGLHYRSSMSYHIAGDARFTHPALPVIASPAISGAVQQLAAGVNSAALFDSPIRSDVKLPAIFNLSFVKAIGGGWEVMADAQWTEWSTIQELRFERADGRLLQETPQHFKDSWKVAVGANYRAGNAWLLRGGLAWDQSPVREAFRTPRLPDSDRVWLSLGAQVAVDPKLKLDFGAAYLQSRSAAIDKSGDPPNAAAFGRMRGDYRNRTLIVSGQMGYTF